MEQRLQLKLKRNTSADLYLSETEFQSVLVGRENAQLESCQSISSVLTDHRKTWFPLHVKCYDHNTKTKRLKG